MQIIQKMKNRKTANVQDGACLDISMNGLKKRAYKSRLREVEHSSFTSLVFSTSRGMGHKATSFYNAPVYVMSD